MGTVSSLLEGFGLATVVAGFALIDRRYGLIAGGFTLILVGLAADPPRRPA